jgi:HEAT repeat protein
MELEDTIEEIIAELADCTRQLLASRLLELSDLSAGELGFLEQVWAEIETERRRQIVSRLVELAEDNIELNFDGIFFKCLKDPDEEVRCSAIDGLWENEESALINPLIDLMEYDTSERVQSAAAIGLGKFASLAELEQLRSYYKSRVCQALLEAFDDKTKPVEVRRRALEAASPLSLPPVKEAIRTAYHSDHHGLRNSAIYAMGRNCDLSWSPFLLRELANTDAEMRYEAVAACGELGTEEAVPRLCELTDDPDTEVRLAAIRALGEIGGTKAKAWLEHCLETPVELIRQAAEQALRELEAWENPLSFRM